MNTYNPRGKEGKTRNLIYGLLADVYPQPKTIDEIREFFQKTSREYRRIMSRQNISRHLMGLENAGLVCRGTKNSEYMAAQINEANFEKLHHLMRLTLDELDQLRIRFNEMGLIQENQLPKIIKYMDKQVLMDPASNKMPKHMVLIADLKFYYEIFLSVDTTWGVYDSLSRTANFKIKKSGEWSKAREDVITAHNNLLNFIVKEKSSLTREALGKCQLALAWVRPQLRERGVIDFSANTKKIKDLVVLLEKE